MDKRERKYTKKTYVKIISVLVSILLVVATVVPYGAAFADSPVVESAAVELPEIVEQVDAPEAVDTADVTTGEESKEQPAAEEEVLPEEVVADDIDTSAPADEEEPVALVDREETDSVVEETEAEEATEEAIPEEAAVDVNMPPQSFDKTVSGIRVLVEAPEGAFPEDTDMAVERVYSQDILDKIADGVEEGVTDVKAVDITFTDKDGNEIEPACDINVTLKDEIVEEDSTRIMHLKDNGAVEEMDTDISGTEASFVSEDFSIYAIVQTGEDARLEVIFMNGESKIADMFVKQGDNMEQVLYDPGVGSLGEKQVFRGWTLDPEYTASAESLAEAKTIEGVRSEASDILDDGVTDGESITYYAMIFDAYHVSYLDDIGVVMQTDDVLYRASGETADEIPYTISMTYTPKDPETQSFEGWNPHPEDGSAEHISGEEGAPYQHEDDVIVSGDVNLIPFLPEGHWISYNENGTGATYTPPEYVRRGNTPTEPEQNPTREGYTFGGWYKTKNCFDGEEFDFGEELTQRTEVFAKWVANETARYSIIIWKESVKGSDVPHEDGGGYDFAKAIVVNDGTVGTVIDAVEASGTGDDAHAIINGDAYEYEGFHLKEFDTNVTVKPEGTSVLNVYYDRNIITMTFYVYGNQPVESYVVATDNSGTQYGLIDGEYVQLTRNGNTWTYDTGSEGYVPTTDTGNSDQQYGLVNGEYVELTRSGSWISGYYWEYSTGEYVYTPTQSTSRNPQQYGYLIDSNEYVVLTRQGNYGQGYYWTYTFGGRVIRYNGTRYLREEEIIRYTGTRYKYQEVYAEYTGTRYKKVSSRWTAQYTFEGRYGSTLADNGYTWPTNYNWYSDHDESSSSVSGTRTTFLDAFLPTENTSDLTFYGGTTTTNKTVIFYKQNADGSGYTEANRVGANGAFLISDKYSGFTAYSYRADNGQTVLLGNKDDDGYYARVDYDNTLRIYYNRDTYEINYMDGVYLDRNDHQIEGTESRGQLHEPIEGIAFGASTTSYAKGGSNYYEPEYTGYKFDGWYADDQCTVPYTFTTMPDGGITVYARWKLIYYRVFLHSNASGDNSLEWGDENQETSFLVPYNSKISEIGGERAGYELVGWYKNPELTNMFNFGAFALNSANVTAFYDKENRTSELDKWGDPDPDATEFNKDIKRDWVPNCLDLYAKWRSTIAGANGIKLVYDVGEGSGDPTDDKLYTDQATAIAVAASTAPSEEKVFSEWVIQKWNGSGYENTDTKVYPGDTFTVLKDYAKVVVKKWVNPNNNQDIYVVSNPEPGNTTPPDATHTKILEAEYTVQITAEYIDKEHETPTHIYWYENIGEDAYVKNNKLEINEAVDIPTAPTREGYKFLGWARVNIGNTQDAAAAWEANSENWTQNLTGSDLYLYYDGSKYHLDSNTGTEVTQVAADEDVPYHAMFAVWQQSLTIKVAGNSDTKPYNGSEQSVEGFKVTKYIIGSTTYDLTDSETVLPESLANIRVSLASGKEAEASGTAVGTYNMELTPAHFVVTGADAYDVKLEIEKDGKLTISQAALTITAKPQTYTYNGSAQGPAGTYTTGFDTYVTVSGLQGSDALTSITLSGSQTAAATYTNEIVPSAAAVGDNTGNYEISYVKGDLTINKANMTVTATGYEGVYDGATHAVSAVASVTDGTTIEYKVGEGEWTTTAPSIKDVGEKEVQVRATNDNYNTATDTATLKVTAAALTITANDKTYTYNGSAQGPAGTYTTGFDTYVTVSGLQGSDALTSITLSGSQTAAGTYTDEIVPSAAAVGDNTGNYTISYVEGDLTINKATLTITANDKTYTYNGSAQGPAGTYTTGFDTYVTVSGLQGSDALTSITLSGSKTAAGTYTDEIVPSAAAVGDNTGNYTISYVEGDLTINKATLTITANDKTYTYNGSAQGPAGTYTTGFDTYVTVSGLQGSDALTSITLSGSKTAAGTYTDEIVPSAAAVGDNTGNYTISYVEGDLTINKATLTITANDKTYTYNGSAQGPAGTYTTGFDTYVTVSGLQGSDALTSITLSGSKTAAGTYTDEIVPSAAAVGDNTGNYTISYVEGDLTINKAALKITVKDQTYDYNGYAQGENNVTYTEAEDIRAKVTVDGLKGSDKLTSIKLNGQETDAYTYNGKIKASEAAVGTATDNYEIEYVAGKLTINTVTLTVTANNQTYKYNGELQGEGDKIYDNPDEIAEKVKVDGLKGDDKIYYVEIFCQGTDAGDEYDVQMNRAVIQNGEGRIVSSNYDIIYVNGKMIIEPRDVMLTSESDSKVYDGTPLTKPEVSVSGDGFVDGEVTDIKATGSVTNVADSPVTNTIIYTEGEKFKAKNYTITKEEGTLEITPKAITVTVNGDSNSMVFNGEEQVYEGTVTAISSDEGFDTSKFSYTGNKAAKGTNIGDYDTMITAASCSYSDKNYTVTWTIGDPVKLTITPAAVTVTANNVSKTAGDNDPTLTATVTGLIGTDTVTYTLSRATGEGVGTYAITPSGAATQGNYTVTYVAGTFTITAAPAPVQPDEPVTPEPTPAPTPTPSRNVTPAADEPEEIPEPETPLAPEPEPEVVPDEPAPLAPPEEIIPDEPAPLAPAEPVVNWALINLIMMIVAIASAVIAIIGAFIKRNKDDKDLPEDQREKNPIGTILTGMFIAIGAAIAAVIAFVLTEDLSGVMQLVDQWTVLMVILGAVAVVFTCISGRGAKKPDQNQKAE